MRKREIQSFTLKLKDLNEYDVVRQERSAAKLQQKLSERKESDSVETVQRQDTPIAKYGPKSKQEIHQRIGFINME